MNKLEFTLILSQLDLLEAQASQLRRIVCAMMDHESGKTWGEARELKIPAEDTRLSDTDEEKVGALLFPEDAVDGPKEN